MQIGTYNLEDDFIELLFSKIVETDSRNWYDFGTLSPPGTDWVPHEFYTINPAIPTPQVPEPSELMLCIIGLGVLMLKRKAHG